MIPGWPNTQTSLAASTAAPPMGLTNVATTDHLCPFQRSARPPVPTSVNAHTSDRDVAAAATTSSSFFPGKLVRVQVFPLRTQAVGISAAVAGLPLNAHAVVLPVATIALKLPDAPLCTDLTMCHDGGAAATALTDPST